VKRAVEGARIGSSSEGTVHAVILLIMGFILLTVLT